MAELVTTRSLAMGNAAAYCVMRTLRGVVGLGGASVISTGSGGLTASVGLPVSAAGLGLIGRGLGLISIFGGSTLATATSVETAGAVVLSIATIATSGGNLGNSRLRSSASYFSWAAVTAAWAES